MRYAWLPPRPFRYLCFYLSGLTVGLASLNAAHAQNTTSLVFHPTADQPYFTQFLQQIVQAQPRLLAARANSQAAAANINEAESALWPVGSYELDESYSDKYQHVGSHGLVARWTAYSGGTLEARVIEQRHLTQAALSVQNSTAHTLVLKASDAAWQLALASEELRIARADLERLEIWLADAEEIVKFDPGRRSDRDQIEQRVILSRQTLQQRESALRRTHFTLQRQLPELQIPGPMLDWLTVVENDPPVRQRADEMDLALVRELVTFNPAVTEARARIQAAQASLEAVRGERKPRITLEAGTRDKGMARVLLNWVGLDAGGMAARERAALQSAESARREAEDKLAENIERAQSEWEQRRLALDRQSLVKSSITLTEKILVAYQEQFRIGKRSLLDLLNLQRELIQQQRELLTARYEFGMGNYRLLAVIGELANLYGYTP